MDDWQSFDDYVNRDLSKPVADNGNGTGSPASGKMRLPLPDVGKRTKKSKLGSGRSRNTATNQHTIYKNYHAENQNQAKKKEKRRRTPICSHFFNHRKRKTGRHPVLSCDPVDLRSPDGFVHPSYGTELLGKPTGDPGLHRRRSSGKELCPGNLSDWGTDLCGLWLYPGTVDRQQKTDAEYGKIRQVDMGRGLFGFVVLVLLAFASTYAYPILPASPAPLEGAKLFFHIVDDLGKSFLFMNVIGAILCVVRKMGTR